MDQYHPEDNMNIKCFEPIIDSNSTTLILGTIPGLESLKKGYYYGNKRNHFWDVLVRVFVDEWDQFDLADQKLSYDQKRTLLLRNNLCLWDVIECCYREGSRDSKIKDEKINNFEVFFGNFPQIRKVIFNGKKAHKFYKQKYKTETFNKEITVLNSTSTTNPNNIFSVLREWKAALKSEKTKG